MKSSCKIHQTTYIYLIIICLSGYINYAIIYLLIMMTHEFGHIIVIKLLKYKINKITIYPWGGVIDTNINMNIKSSHLFLISIAGITMQILLFIIAPHIGYNYNVFKKLNTSLIIYNLLPIFPLDGYKILISICEKFGKYRVVIKAAAICSYILTIYLLIQTKSIFIFIVIFVLNIKNILIQDYTYNKFLLERYLYGTPYHKKVIVNSHKDYHKCKNNLIKHENSLKSEKEYLDMIYRINGDI